MIVTFCPQSLPAKDGTQELSHSLLCVASSIQKSPLQDARSPSSVTSPTHFRPPFVMGAGMAYIRFQLASILANQLLDRNTSSRASTDDVSICDATCDASCEVIRSLAARL